MLLRCQCPGCGDLKEYVAEQVGTTADCFKCGRQFEMKANPGRVTWHIVAATLAVLMMTGGAGARWYLRAKRYENLHRHGHVHVQPGPTDDDDRDDN